MGNDVYTFLLRGVLLFLFLELLTLPLRGPLTGLLGSLLPPGFGAVWECTGLDEVFLFLSFLLAYPAPLKQKKRFLLLGPLVIELYNALRIALVVYTNSPLLHDILFRWGGFLLVLFLFYVSFRSISSPQRPSRRPSRR